MKLDKLFEMTQDKAPNNGLTFAFMVRGSKGSIFVATDKSVSALGLDEQSLLLKIMKTLDYEPTYTTTSIENTMHDGVVNLCDMGVSKVRVTMETIKVLAQEIMAHPEHPWRVTLRIDFQEYMGTRIFPYLANNWETLVSCGYFIRKMYVYPFDGEQTLRIFMSRLDTSKDYFNANKLELERVD